MILGSDSVRLVARTTTIDVEILDLRRCASMQLCEGGLGEGGVVEWWVEDLGVVEMEKLAFTIAW